MVIPDHKIYYSVKSKTKYSVETMNTAIGFVFRYGKRMPFILLYFLLILQAVHGQEKVPCNEITMDMGFMVQSVRIMGRWVPKEVQVKVEQLAGLGEIFDPARMSTALELVRDELIKNETDFAIRLTGSTSVLYIDSEVCDVSDSSHARQVQVVIRAYYLRIDLYNIGRNILPVPRSARPTFFREVPAALLVTSPVLRFNNDRQYGPSIAMQISTNLLEVSRIKKSDPSKPIVLNVDLDIRKSFIHPFHILGVNLNLVHPVYSSRVIGWNVGVRYAQNQQPLAKGQYNRELFRMYGSIQGSSKMAIFKKYALGLGARFLQNRYNLVSGNELENPENGYEFFALSDGRLLKGFSRLGIWFDAGNPTNSNALKPYQRLAACVGYGIVLGSGHKNIDVETTLGGGHTWGSSQPYSRFFAGLAPAGFLYEPFNAIQNRVNPEGPVIRSLGEMEGGLRSSGGVITGGTAYWHMNLNFSIPVSTWARPLIPDILLSEEPRRMTLRTALKAQSSTAKNFIIDDLISDHGFADDEQTEAIADKMIDKDIRPTLNYLADRANVYSIKPLLLFDIAQITDRVLETKTWLAAGLGVQVNIVIARLELGYMQTLSPASDSGIGNLFLRFTLQNFY